MEPSHKIGESHGFIAIAKPHWAVASSCSVYLTHWDTLSDLRMTWAAWNCLKHFQAASMSLLIRYTHIPFYFCFSFAFSTLLIHHYAPPLWRDCARTTIALAPLDWSRLFDGHMTYDSHVFTSILSISNVPPPAVRPIMSSRTAWSGTFYNFTLCSHSCLPFIFNLPVFTFCSEHHHWSPNQLPI